MAVISAKAGILFYGCPIKAFGVFCFLKIVFALYLPYVLYLKYEREEERKEEGTHGKGDLRKSA